MEAARLILAVAGLALFLIGLFGVGVNAAVNGGIARRKDARR